MVLFRKLNTIVQPLKLVLFTHYLDEERHSVPFLVRSLLLLAQASRVGFVAKNLQRELITSLRSWRIMVGVSLVG